MYVPPKSLLKRRGKGGGAFSILNRTAACERCECQLCSICSKPANRYTSPLGQTIDTITTRTEPRFTFAYNPLDDDMARMRKTLILEPKLTHAWHEATWRCCNQTNGLVIDVGGNFGWYTLYSLALGCRVAVFEPVPAYQEIMQLGLSLNPGFAARTTLYGNVVYDKAGKYPLRVPIPNPYPSGRKKKLGMTGMEGSAGILKADWRAQSYLHYARSARIDDIIDGAKQPICMLKADVEGYEPQVLQTARKLLTAGHVPALQLEMTRTPKLKNQTCAMMRTLAQLADLGYDFRQVNNKIVDKEAPPIGSWTTTPGPWDSLPPFPSERTRESSSRLHTMGLQYARDSPRAAAAFSAYKRDFTTFSTNLIGTRSANAACSSAGAKGKRRCKPWPALEC